MDKNNERLKSIFVASIVGIVVNIAIGLFKAAVGFITNSIAITMDAINNFSDAASSFITVLSSYFAVKDPNKKHPFGYGRVEYLGTLLIAILISYAGISSFVESVKGIFDKQTAEYSSITLMIIVVAVFVKVALSVYIIKVGNKVKSDSLIASGKESIGDIIISISTIVAAFVYMYANISIEAWIGAIIAILITKTGVQILFETVGKILGTSGDVTLVRNIKKAIVEHEHVSGAYDLILHNYGPGSYLASVHVEVEDTLSINKFDDLCREIEADIMERFGVRITAIGVYSVNTEDESIIEKRETVKKIALDIQYVNQLHGFYIDTEKKCMRFDLVISFDAKDRRQVYRDVLDKIGEKYPDYSIKAGMDSDYNELP